MAAPKKSYAFVLSWPIEATGGVNEVVRNLLAEVESAGELEPVLIESHWASHVPQVDQHAGHTRIRLRLRALGGPGLRESLLFLATLPATLLSLKRLARQHGIVAFNVHFPELDAWRWAALRRLGMFRGRVILSFHGSDIRNAHRLGGWRRRLFRRLLVAVDQVVSCSHGLASEITALAPRARIAVVHNGIDARRFAAEGNAPHPVVVLPEGDRILCIGKFQEGKAHDLLVRAFAALAVNRPAARLILVGSTGPTLEATRRAVREAGLDERVMIHCDVPHAAVPGLLRSSRLLVLCSRWLPGRLGEGFPIVLLEAGAMETPIVATRTCGADEIVTDGVTGRLVPLDDAVALAAAMREVLDDPETAGLRARELAKRIRDELTWERAYRSYAALVRTN
jgi:glycosyltransferase involved in cell wall biosynthesis